MINKKFKKKLLVLVLLFFQSVSLIYAGNELNLPETKINPDSFYYSFKRLWEKTVDKFTFSNRSKISYHSSLVKTRMAELKYIADNRILSVIEDSSKRFAYEAGTLTDYLVKENNKELSKATTEEFQKYSNMFGDLRDKYPANSSFWLLLQQEIDTLGILSDRLK